MKTIDPKDLLTPRERVWYPYRFLPTGIGLVAHIAYWLVYEASWMFFCSLVGWFLLTSVPRWYFKSRIATVSKEAWKRLGIDVTEFSYGLEIGLNNMLMVMGPLVGIVLLCLAYFVL